MDYETIFLMGVYLLPLAFVSFISSWTHGRRPVTAIIFAFTGLALLIFVDRNRPRGLYNIDEIPVLTARLVARILSVF